MTGSPGKIPYFRVNPVEVVVFLAIAGIFIHSMYRLFNDRNGFHAAALAPMAANPVSEGRVPAAESFTRLEVNCDAKTDHATSAVKVRLTGKLCGAGAGPTAKKLQKTLVQNKTNNFSATVFSQEDKGQFSTDYIPLNAGKNSLTIEFSYKDGKVVTQEMVVTRN